MSNICEINTKDIDRILTNLNEENRKKAMKTSLMNIADYIQEETKMQLRKDLGTGAYSTNHRKKPMEQGIRVKEKDSEDVEISVNLYGDYRLKYFEIGTKIRKLLRSGAKDYSKGRIAGKRMIHRKEGSEKKYKAGANRGRITGLHFFKEVRNNGNIVVKLLRNLDKEISKLLK